MNPYNTRNFAVTRFVCPSVNDKHILYKETCLEADQSYQRQRPLLRFSPSGKCERVG